jgi:hypothetical protein
MKKLRLELFIELQRKISVACKGLASKEDKKKTDSEIGLELAAELRALTFEQVGHEERNCPHYLVCL